MRGFKYKDTEADGEFIVGLVITSCIAIVIITVAVLIYEDHKLARAIAHIELMEECRANKKGKENAI